MSEQPERYHPPAAHACVPWEAPIDLGLDRDRCEAHVLYVNVRFYRNLTVWFSLQQLIRDASGERHTVCRIDCCDGEIHRHVFKEGQGEIDRVTLVRIPVHGQTVVDGEYGRYYDDMTGNWEERVRRWRLS